MRVGGARHGDGVVVVLEAVFCFVLHLVARGLFFHAGREAAALNHEAVDHAMENGVVVVTVFDVLDEIGSRFRRFVGVQFDGDIAVTGLEFDHSVLSLGDYGITGLAYFLTAGFAAASMTVTFSMVTVCTGTF